VDASKACLGLALAIVARTLFGADLGTRTEEISTAVEEVSRRALQRAQAWIPTPLAWPTPGNRAYRRAIQTLDACVRALLRAEPNSDVFARLSATVDPRSGRTLDERDLRDEGMSLFLAGHETTASTLAWTLDHLARAPELQARLRAEARERLGDGAQRAEGLADLPLLDAVVSEVLRLHPPAWLLMRRALAADELAGFEIPARSFLSVPVYTIHRLASLWPDPERFRPERFLDGAPPHPCAFLPFGAGPRRCLGEAFARAETRVVLTRLLERFELRPVGAPPEPAPFLTLRPASAVRLVLETVNARSSRDSSGVPGTRR
jgi:cytochrome P450